MESVKILIADDNSDIVDIIDEFLVQEGFETIKAYDGESALQRILAGEVSLAILDVMMPGMDGFTVAETARKQSNIPILMLSAKTREDDIVQGLDRGADEYLTKPFHKRELLAHVRSLLRRYMQFGAAPITSDENVMVHGELKVDRDAKRVTILGNEIKLTSTEYKILELLMAHPGRVYSISEIYERIWDLDAVSAENSVALHIGRLRKKIEENPKKPKYIKVVWGMGYKFEKE